MVYYCSTSDVGLRLGLNSAQRVQAGNTLQVAIRRASIEIEQVYNDYGRSNPIVIETTANGAVSVGDTTITLTSASAFAIAGSGNIDGDTISWTGKSSNDLTGVTGVSIAHASGVTVQQGEFAPARVILNDLPDRGFISAVKFTDIVFVSLPLTLAPVGASNCK